LHPSDFSLVIATARKEAERTVKAADRAALASFAPVFEIRGRNLWMMHAGVTADLGLVVAEKGDLGPRGVDGNNGRDGLDGKSGIDGQDGRNGADGRDGVDGNDGADGKDGVGVSKAYVSDAGYLILEFTDGRKVTAGYVKGKDGKDGAGGQILFGGGSGSQGGGGEGGASAWGEITGTLSAQTDLQSALDAKASTASLSGYQPLSSVLTATTASYTTAEAAKLSGISPSATANSSDAALRDRTTHTGNAPFLDGVQIQIGTGADLKIYHDGANSFIDNATGTLNLRGGVDITNAAGTETMARFVPDDGVYLRFNNTARLWTTGTGAEVFGNIVVSGTVDGRDVSVDGTKLDGIASGATANSADATLLNRTNHTGTQLAATISDFATAADAQVAAGITGKQDTLVSATNIKTINGASVLGAGDLTVASTAPVVTTFDYTGAIQSYSIPAGATKLHITNIGGGGNGGAGFSRTAGSAGGGGGGGGAGGVSNAEFIVSKLGVSTLYVSPCVSSGGNVGYVSLAANSTAQNLISRVGAGANATNGTAAAAGGAGAAGTVATIAQQVLASLGIAGFLPGQIGAAGGVHTGAVGASVTWGNTGITNCSGAGGAGCTTTNFAGGAITGNGAVVTNLTGGIAGGGAGQDGVEYTGRQMWTGGSGGGSNNTGTGGAGGAGAIGCGGGGGGAGVTGGAGGAGGNGRIIITAFF